MEVQLSCGDESQPPSKPDVTIGGITLKNGILTVNVLNSGEVDIAPDADGGLNIWIDGQLGWTYSWGTWACQDFRTAGQSCDIQPQRLSGSHTVKACVDPNNALAESDERNNCRTVQLSS